MAESSRDRVSPRRRVATVLAIAAGLAFVGLMTPLPFHGRTASAVGNLFHAPLFLGLTVICLWAWNTLSPIDSSRQQWTQKQWIQKQLPRALVAAIAMAIVGGIMEGLQSFSLRSSSWHDAFANGIGAVAGAILFLGWQYDRQKTRNGDSGASAIAVSGLVVSVLVAGLMLGYVSSGPIAVIRDARAVTHDFPMLAPCETEAELGRWYCHHSDHFISDAGVTHGNHSLAVRFRRAPFTAITLTQMVRDWSGMRSLELDVTVDAGIADPVVRLMVKVTDGRHSDVHEDSFHRYFEIPRGGSRHVSIERDDLIAGPAGRDLDLSDIRYMDFAVDGPQGSTVLYFDHVRIVGGR